MKANPGIGEAVKLVEISGVSDALVIGQIAGPEYMSASARMSLMLLTVIRSRVAAYEEHRCNMVPHLSKYGPERKPYWVWPHELEKV